MVTTETFRRRIRFRYRVQVGVRFHGTTDGNRLHLDLWRRHTATSVQRMERNRPLYVAFYTVWLVYHVSCYYDRHLLI